MIELLLDTITLIAVLASPFLGYALLLKKWEKRIAKRLENALL